jgi:metal-responsive CopG/Arc/MetJ family transcriptional regulator
VSKQRTHNTARLPLRIPQKLLDDLDAYVAGKSITRSLFVRDAIAAALDRQRSQDRWAAARRAADAQAEAIKRDAASVQIRTVEAQARATAAEHALTSQEKGKRL